MLSGILSPAFLQAASNISRGIKGNYIRLLSNAQDPTITDLSCGEKFIIQSVKNGQKLIVEYSAQSHRSIQVSADANTDIFVIGNIIDIHIANQFIEMSINCTTLLSLDCSGWSNFNSDILMEAPSITHLNTYNCTGLTSLDLSHNTALTSLDVSNCTGLTSLDLSHNTALTSLNIESCENLTSLDLSANTALTSLFENYYVENLSVIKYPATDSNVSSKIATLIGYTNNSGTVYTDSAGAYYSTIETAANNKGWTIEQL